jgi:hypothetical protein
LVALLASFAGTVRADEIMFMDSIPLTSTDWSKSVSIPKFNTALGDLEKVTIMLMGTISSDPSIQNLDSESHEVTTHVEGKVTLKRPSGTDLVVTLPPRNDNAHLGPWTGILPHFAATDGIDFGTKVDSKSETVTSTSPGELALFEGVGNITLPVSAEADARATGSGNLLALFHTSASAQATVTYQFAPAAAPEPSTWLLAGLGVAGLWVYRRFRR